SEVSHCNGSGGEVEFSSNSQLVNGQTVAFRCIHQGLITRWLFLMLERIEE
ncbi:hypothetical protein L195_g060870, partial [Trifolium pratense]